VTLSNNELCLENKKKKMMSTWIEIAGKKIGQGLPPFIIAELSGNHQQSYALAVAMIEAAAKAGAHAIKLQTYTPDSMTLAVNRGEFVIQDADSLWRGEALYDLYQKAATPYAWHEGLFKRARELGLIAFSSPFDAAAVDFLEGLDVPCYKIASFENTDLPLIKRIAETGKPIIMSTGMASVEELQESVDAARTAGCRELILLKCTSAYPSPAEDIHLATMQDMRERFGCPVGLSDHTTGIEIALAATALGASVIEKHFVLDRQAGGVDAAFSVEPAELESLVRQSQRVFDALGAVNYGQTHSDQTAKFYRRSLYVSQDIKAGETATPDNIKIVRPGLGIAPKYYEQLLGKIARQHLQKGTPVHWDLFE
jgi:N-acetylneuraminate synthase